VTSLLTALPTLPTWTDLSVTADSIARTQRADGAIPWEPGRHVDPWDHVECTMALVVAGRHLESSAAWAWLRKAQRPDGSWAARTSPEAPTPSDLDADTNHAAYPAVGLWHDWLVREDLDHVVECWPMVRAALDFAVAQQLPFGGVAWTVGAGGRTDTALLAGSASIRHSLHCGIRLAELVGDDAAPAAAWAVARDRIDAAIRDHEGAFEDKRRFSMDWYYPVLAGTLRGGEARDRIDARWDEFVVPGLGIRCVDDHPWVTGAETCELALALEALGDHDRAAALVADMQHLRDESGSYHTGLVFADDKRWPVEQSTWTAAAVILAMDALTDHSPGADAFR
jgi:GH15 family glucan-1,4-alpha-glucosidase